ncbi:MAG TPA: hypothetical protein ENN41_08555 [Sediminispirochaeta sp.]|nr:hypothetical protein [Sediminispirochaeta sp.]
MKLSIFKITIALTFFFLFPSLATAQEYYQLNEGTKQKLEAILAESNFSSAEKQVMYEIFAHVQKKEVPSEMLLPRLQEGVAKQVPLFRLSTALERDLDNLIVARDLILKNNTSESYIKNQGSWQRIANMLAAGFDQDEIVGLLELCSGKPEEFRHVSLLYAALQKWGIADDEIMDVSRALVSSPIPSTEYIAVMDLYRAARGRRIRPEELSERIIVEAKNVERVEELERRILY